MAGNAQDSRSNTYVDDSGVERFRGSNNRVDRSNNSSSGKGSSNGSSGSSSGGSSGSSGTRKKTTYTFKDGKTYTGYETNWEDAARKAGNTSGLSQAISYPDYVNDTEARRYLDEMGKRYGVTPGAATGAYENAVSKEFAATDLYRTTTRHLTAIYRGRHNRSNMLSRKYRSTQALQGTK